MRKNSRAFKIYELGLNEVEDISISGMEMLKAIAVMIDAATCKKKPKTELAEKMVYSEKDILQLFPELQVARYGRLNRVLKTISKLQISDVANFEQWFTEVMKPWLDSNDVQFTYSMLCRKFPEWLEKARSQRTTFNGGNQKGWT